MGKYQEIWKIFLYIYKPPQNPPKPRYLAMKTLKCRLFLLYIPHSPINICTSLEIPQKTSNPKPHRRETPSGGYARTKPLPRTYPIRFRGPTQEPPASVFNINHYMYSEEISLYIVYIHIVTNIRHADRAWAVLRFWGFRVGPRKRFRGKGGVFGVEMSLCIHNA